jgi:hypothetical protein
VLLNEEKKKWKREKKRIGEGKVEVNEIKYGKKEKKKEENEVK